MGTDSALYRQHMTVLTPAPWYDYELLDTGGGQKLERFGPYRLVRPETQAIWSPALPPSEWKQADARFEQKQQDDGPGIWVHTRPLPEQWDMHYNKLIFRVRLTPFRHTGVFPEHHVHWEWMRRQLGAYTRRPEVLVLFGYTGIASLVAAQAGANVCHVDASRPAMRWARENQTASDLHERPIRWIVDDVVKFVRREVRRGSRYDMVVMDPPVFGRGPKGEIWRLHEALPDLVHTCCQLLHDQPAGVLINAYATTISSLTVANVLAEAMHDHPEGSLEAGELVLYDTSVRRPLSLALFARWTGNPGASSVG